MADAGSVRVFTTPETHRYSPSCPWRFEVTYEGRTYGFAGTPNYCESRRSAAMRASYRRRWLVSGEFARRYT